MAAMFWNMIYGNNSEQKDLNALVQKNDLEGLLKVDRIKNELTNNSSQVTHYFAKPETVSRLLDILYDPSPDPEKRQLNTAANDIFMCDNSLIMDTIANNP